MNRLNRLLLCFCLLFFTVTAFAIRRDWTGNVNDSWNEPLNWIPIGIPTAADSVFTFYGDDIVIPSGYTAEAEYVRLLHTFNNFGTLKIEGGKLDVFWNFNNYGTIEILNSTLDIALDIDPIQNINMIFNNYGDIIIDGATGDAIAQYTFNKLINFQTGLIEVKNFNGSGFRVLNVENYGRIRIDDSGTEGFSLDVATDTLWNRPCGIIRNFNKWEVLAGLVMNDGLIRESSSFSHVFINDLENNGVLQDVDSKFLSSQISNSGIWIKSYLNPLDEGKPTKIFTTSNAVDHTCSGLYNDKNLTSFAGVYNNTNHLWTPNSNAVGDTQLYLEITYTALGCKDTVIFKPTIPVRSVNYWVGNNGSWMNSSNWSYGTVPAATDKTAIYKKDAQVWIPSNNSVSVKDFYLKSDFLIRSNAELIVEDQLSYYGVYCDSCTIVNNGLLYVDKASLGLYVNRGKLINNQTINCDSTYLGIVYGGSSTDTSTYVKNYGLIQGSLGPVISGNSLSFYNYGNILLSDIKNKGIETTNLINYGNVDISGLNNTEGAGIESFISNHPSGSIFLRNLQYGIKFSDFSNEGMIDVDSCASAIYVFDASENVASGVITIRNSAVGLEISDVMTNHPNGEIAVLNCETGISIQSSSLFSSSLLINEGSVMIDSSMITGINIQGSLYNQAAGLLRITNSGGDGIFTASTSNRLDNIDEASLIIRNCAGNGMQLLSTSFKNGASAKLSIDSIGLKGLYLGKFGSSFSTSASNFGQIELGASIVGDGFSSDGTATFTNALCFSQVTSEASYVFAGTFTNHGIYHQAGNATVLLYPGFNNLGLISDPYHLFQGSFFVNNGIHVIEKTGTFSEGEVISDVVIDATAGTSSIQISSDWYLDQNLTIVAGTFNQIQNEFTPSVAATDSTRFYFTVQNTSCSSALIDTLFIDFENPIQPSCGNISWIGGKGQWFNATKWDKNRLPTTCDTVIITQMLDSVILNNATPVILNRIENHGNLLISGISEIQLINSPTAGIANFHNIQNAGIIDISMPGTLGYAGFDQSSFYNNGELNILDTGTHGLWLRNATFYNEPSAFVQISNSQGSNLRLVQVSTFYQRGSLLSN